MKAKPITVTLARPVIRPASIAIADQVQETRTLLDRQVFKAQNSESRFTQVFLLSLLLLPHSQILSTYSMPSARYCLGYTIAKTLQRKLHYRLQHANSKASAQLHSPSLAWARSSEQLPRHQSRAWVRAGSAPGCRLQGSGQLWELSASSQGVHTVHFISNVVSDGVQLVLSKNLSHAPETLSPEASQGARAGHT